MERVVLETGDMRAALLSYGATTQGWWLNDAPLILGYDDPEAYRSDPNFMGAIVGRLANRVSGAAFDLNGVRYGLDPNEGANQLHGGAQGLWTRDWHLEQTSASEARLTYHSPNDECGYPGAVDISVWVTLGPDSLTYEIEASPDRPTPLSLAQHNYYTLGDPAGPRSLRVEAARLLQLGEGHLPTGRLIPVGGSPFDLRAGAPLADTDIDHFYLFDPEHDPAAPVAVLTGPTGLTLSVHSDQPGAQIYTGHGLAPPFPPGAGTCIEPSGFPDAVNIPTFPSVIATPDAPYRQTLRLSLAGEIR